jgi:hypothetical protein
MSAEFEGESFSSKINFIMPKEYENVNGVVELSDGEMITEYDSYKAVIGYRIANGMFSEIYL